MEIAAKKFVAPAGMKSVLIAALGIGVAAFVIGLRFQPERAWANFLLEYYFWLCIALAGIFFVALQYITGSMWSVPLRRIAECFVAYLPAALVLFPLLLRGTPILYEWTHHETIAADPILSLKTAYLNKTFFVVRNVFLLVISLGVGGWMMFNSVKQDRSGDPRFTKLNVRLAAPFILVFAWAFSFVSIDLMMSLAPHWYSTIFGVYCWADLFVSGVATLTLVVVGLKRLGYLQDIVNENHLHDLGKLLFAFLVFWGYIGFSQFMLIWYANLPEETLYFMQRLTPGWKTITLALIPVKFVIPFFLLVSRTAKRNAKLLTVGAVWLLAAQWFDIYWLVFPTFFSTPHFGWLEIGMLLGFTALFLLCVTHLMSRVSLVAIKDPYFHEGVHHHQ